MAGLAARTRQFHTYFRPLAFLERAPQAIKLIALLDTFGRRPFAQARMRLPGVQAGAPAKPTAPRMDAMLTMEPPPFLRIVPQAPTRAFGLQQEDPENTQ